MREIFLALRIRLQFLREREAEQCEGVYFHFFQNYVIFVIRVVRLQLRKKN